MCEVLYAAMVCAKLGGEAFGDAKYPIEQRVTYNVHAEKKNRWIEVDCMTERYAIEVGLDDKRDSFDSLHQAIFAAVKTGREPMIAIVDTNDVEEKEQYQIEVVARYANVEYRVFSKHELERWYWAQRYVNNRPYHPGKIVDLDYVHRSKCHTATPTPSEVPVSLGLDKVDEFANDTTLSSAEN